MISRSPSPYGLQGGPGPGFPDYWPVMVFLLCLVLAAVWMTARYFVTGRNRRDPHPTGGFTGPNLLVVMSAISFFTGLFTMLWRVRHLYRRMELSGTTSPYLVGRAFFESLEYFLAALAASTTLLLLALVASYKIKRSRHQDE